MAFVLERVSPEDIQRYRLAELDERYRGTRGRDWVVDRQREVYLRMMRAGGREQTGRFVWTLYWKGWLIEVHTQRLKTMYSPDGRSEIEQHERVESMLVPDAIAGEREAVKQLFREARVAYREAGTDSTSKVFSLTIDF